ncbi:MAG: TniB family NTP-binding protein [Moraxellaceae bacterium]|nr:TniB family NTP-binding protein [Moraxellaceae bacterium]
MSLFQHIHPEFRHVMMLSDKERLDFLQQSRWIGYPNATQIMDTLDKLLEMPTRIRMPNLLIVGEPNNGKTTIVRRFHQLRGIGYVNDESEPVKPVIIAEAPPSADEKGLYISILERFYAPYKPTDSAARLRYQTIHLMRQCSVRMLVIDEFHSLLTGGAQKQREVMNCIKLLCNELAIPIVGVGTREAVRVLHTDPQHTSRFDVIGLPLWKLNKEFQQLVAGFESVLPLKKPSNLSSIESTSLLHLISDGCIGNLHRLLVECANSAIMSGEEKISLSLIESKKWLRPTRGIRELMA